MLEKQVVQPVEQGKEEQLRLLLVVVAVMAAYYTMSYRVIDFDFNTA